MSGLVNKVKDALHSDKSHKTENTHTTGTHTTGTHTTGHTGGLHESSHATTGTYDGGLGSTGTTGSTNRGQHSSNLANKADPRIDSDGDHSRNLGANPHGTATTGSHNTHTLGTSGTTGTHNTHTLGSTGTTGSTNRGTHNSNLANKADPRIDSDGDRSRNMGANPHGTATTGTHNTNTLGSSGNTMGSSRTAGTAYDNSHSGVGSTGMGSTGRTAGGLESSLPGPASKTAGSHNSNVLNQIDPRIDSDLDGSKTVGGNKTFTQ